MQYNSIAFLPDKISFQPGVVYRAYLEGLIRTDVFPKIREYEWNTGQLWMPNFYDGLRYAI
jgi:hypothetical protein